MMKQWAFLLKFVVFVQFIFQIINGQNIPFTNTNSQPNLDKIVGYCKCTTRSNCDRNSLIGLLNDELCKKPREIACCLEDTTILLPNGMTLSDNIMKRLPKPVFNLAVPPKCGQRAYDQVLSKIFTESVNDFPWMVSISVKPEPGYVSDAASYGGSLIHPQVVLTAASCFSADLDFTTLIITVGQWNEQYDSQFKQTRKVRYGIIQPEYSPKTEVNNTALLFLDSAVELNDNVRLACIGAVDFNLVDINDCWLTGWGQISTQYNREELKKVELSLLPRKDCLDSLKRNVGGNGNKLQRNFICASKRNNQSDDFCYGDEGGPLVCRYKEVYVQVGIAAWFYKCGMDNTPYLFTDVGHFVNWIQEEMRFQSLELSVIN